MKLFCNNCDGVYDSLDVRFTKSCDNNCDFCIEKQGIDNLGMAEPSTLIESTKKAGIKSVLILGGEPLLFIENVLEYIKGIRDFADTIYLTTSLPITIMNNRKSVDEIINLLDGINISIQSSDWEENNKILKASSEYNRIELLKNLNKKHSDKIRVSINLVRGGIDSKEKLLKTISKLESCGCKNIKINELQNSPSLYVSFEDIMKIKMKSPYSHGCSTKIKIDGVTAGLILKRSCFIEEVSREATVSDFIKALVKHYVHNKKNRFSVMYENGMVTKGWATKCQTKN